MNLNKLLVWYGNFFKFKVVVTKIFWLLYNEEKERLNNENSQHSQIISNIIILLS